MLKRLLRSPLRLPALKPYVPQPDDPSIFRFNAQRDGIVHEVVVRVVSEAAKDPAVLDETINDTAIQERKRLAAQRDDETAQSYGFWDGVYRRLAKMDESEKRHALHEITAHMARDIAGNFDTRVYHMAESLVPRLLSGVMQPTSMLEELAGAQAQIDRLLETEGPVEKLRALSKRGTLVFTPTHSSNLDSVVLGYALQRNRLPPLVYGAGKNLFTNPIVSFFMHNLGAYRVDRRIQASLYKAVLKTYSCVLIERGFHSLFFPGGTRSRSNHLESRLKLGLAGSAVEAFTRSQALGHRTRVWFVPTTINYDLVLEAETLIDDFLKERGKERYIIDDDEFSRVERWVSFFRKVLGLHSAAVVRFGEPVDPFGNPVAERGDSVVHGGRSIDPATYVMRENHPVIDEARDRAYTRELADVLVRRFREETVVMGNQLVAHALYRRFVRATPGLDIFSRMREKGSVAVPIERLGADVGEARDALLELERQGRVHVSETLRHARPLETVHRALLSWQGYHTKTAATLREDGVVIDDPSLLFYYQNRLVPFAEAIASDADRPLAREIVNQQVR